MRAQLALAFSLLSSGCEDREWPDTEPYCVTSEPTRPIAGGEAPSLHEVCTVVAESLCAQWQRCGCDDGSGGIDLTACRMRIAPACAAFVSGPDVEDAIRLGRVVASSAETATFLDELRVATEDCAPVDLDLSGLLVGTVEDGVTCADISGAFTECIDGSSCQTGVAAPGRRCAPDPLVTGPTQRVGERCGACAPSLRCAPRCGAAWSTGVCVVLTAADGECLGDWECESDYCALTSGSDPTARRGRCAIPRTTPLDAACTSDRACESGFCDGDIPFGEPVVIAGRCASLWPLDHDCATNTECESGSCLSYRLVEVNRCTRSDATCATDTECGPDGGTCITTARRGRCGRLRLDGSRCAGPAECASHRCDVAFDGAYRCAPDPTDLPRGSPCSSDAECAEGECVSEVCAAPVGALCSTSAECASRSCIARACTAAACSARIDPTGHGSFWHRPPVLTPR